MDVVIYHNPNCGTSRNVLKIIEAAGYTPTVIDYLKSEWTKPQLLGLFAAAGLTPRTALREKKSPAAELGLLEEGVSGEDPRRHDQTSDTCEPPNRLHAKRCPAMSSERSGS